LGAAGAGVGYYLYTVYQTSLMRSGDMYAQKLPPIPAVNTSDARYCQGGDKSPKWIGCTIKN
jgi:hypothetical protein